MVRVVDTSKRDGKGYGEEILPSQDSHPTIIGGSAAMSRMNNYGKKAHKEHEDRMKAMMDARADQQPSIPNIVMSIHDDMI
ncbi:hypothetical protein [Methylocystis heyeri]|uniref:Uncharacterized protein n=1 Tax=Methylocystis heyeri TaxID=391905 RepID=A0A6B8KER4_9HYPH|nr:hypothetical protein [Methylocystis heyeri]QGM46112.1 hypothetical protein H2LOC_010635 [Methylocystis heyeri]